MSFLRLERAPSRPLVVTTIALSAALLSGSASGEGAADDGVAPGAVAFFGSDTGACPEGWQPADYAAGRLVVGVIQDTTVGHKVGAPLANQEDRTHTHPFTTSVDLPSKALAAADGGNNQGAQAKAYDVSHATDPAPSGLPFIQLLACEKQ